MTSSLLHLVGLRPRGYYTLTTFKGWVQGPLPLPPSIRQCHDNSNASTINLTVVLMVTNPDHIEASMLPLVP